MAVLSTALHTSLSRLVATALSVLLPLVFASIGGLMLCQERIATGKSAGQQADNIATILQHDIGHTIAVIDSALKDVVAGLPVVLQQPLTAETKQLILFDSAMRQSEYGAVLVLDEHGIALFDSKSATPRQRDFISRDWFKTARDNPSTDLVIGLTPKGLSDLPVITFSRRLTHKDGSFGGVVIAALQMSLFKNMFESLKLGPRDDVIFRTSDGRGIYRRSTGSATFGMDVTNSQLFRATKDAQTALIETVSVEDQVGRLFAFRRLGDLPLVVIVGLSTEDIYATWWSETWILGTSLAILLLLASLLASRLRREFARRERVETELRTSEGNFRLLADNASDMISRVDCDGDRNYVSPAAERLLGVAAENLLGKSLWDYIEPDDKLAVVQMAQQLRSGIIRRGNICFRIRRADSEQRWIEAVAQPVLDPITRELGGYVSAWRDVTDRKHTEARLSESELRYRTLANNATDIVTCLDLNLRRTYVSPSATMVLGYEPEELMGEIPVTAIHPDDTSEATRLFSRLQLGSSDHEILTNRIRHKDGHYVWVEAKLSLMRTAAGCPSAIICSVRDISERKTNETQLLAANSELERISRHLAKARDTAEQASRAKSRFLANISHELRTPLNGILGYAQLLQIEGDLNTKQTGRVASMLGAGQHLLEMINCVLDLSEIEAGRVELRPKPTSLADIIAACVDLIRPAADRKKLLLVRELAPDLPERLMVDPTRLRQILLNLLGNAVKFTQTGVVSLHARRVREATVRFDIIDTGPGIPAKQRDRLFNDFDRLGFEGADDVEGAGLGLALSRRLAIVMGGSLGYMDNLTGGSVFWFEFPLQSTEPSVSAYLTPAPAEQQVLTPAAGLHVLVVDDVAVNRDVAASFLRAAGHYPTCANSGEEAVAVAGDNDLDLILIDVRMPGMDGLEATRRIRALEGARGQVAVVALTAQVFADQLSACEAAGMDGHLTKPFTEAALSAILVETAAAATTRKHAKAGRPAPIVDAVQSSCKNSTPLLETSIYRQTTDLLSESKISAHLQTLCRRTEAMTNSLKDSQPEASMPAVLEKLAETVHAVVGSAGIFGFQRLLMVGQQYEYAARAQTSDVPSLTLELITIAEASHHEMMKLCDQLRDDIEGV